MDCYHLGCYIGDSCDHRLKTHDTQKIKTKPNKTLQILKHKEKEQERNKQELQKTTRKQILKMAVSTQLSGITLNINGLNAPNKNQSGRMDKKKPDPSI